MGNCYNSSVVNAPADEVWSRLRNFHDMSWAPIVVTRLEVIGDKGACELGARRKLNDAFLETLTELNDDERTLAYTIDDGPGPLRREVVDRYTGRVRVFPVTATGQSFVLWTSEYATRDDRAVAELCSPIYQALLTELAAQYPVSAS